MDLLGVFFMDAWKINGFAVFFVFFYGKLEIQGFMVSSKKQQQHNKQLAFPCQAWVAFVGNFGQQNTALSVMYFKKGCLQLNLVTAWEQILELLLFPCDLLSHAQILFHYQQLLVD